MCAQLFPHHLLKKRGSLEGGWAEWGQHHGEGGFWNFYSVPLTQTFVSTMPATDSMTMALKSVSRLGPEGFFSWKVISLTLLYFSIGIFNFFLIFVSSQKVSQSVFWWHSSLFPTSSRCTLLPFPSLPYLTSFVPSLSFNPESNLGYPHIFRCAVFHWAWYHTLKASWLPAAISCQQLFI